MDNNKIKLQKQIWYLNNKEKTLERGRIWRESNKEKIKKRSKISNRLWRKNNPHYRSIDKKGIFNRKSWEGYIPKETKCQICGKEIFFNQNNQSLAIHFDHIKENLSITIKPTTWLSKNRRTSENEKIWESCNFGMLCHKCNLCLPTKNRLGIVKYLLLGLQAEGYTIDKLLS